MKHEGTIISSFLCLRQTKNLLLHIYLSPEETKSALYFPLKNNQSGSPISTIRIQR